MCSVSSTSLADRSEVRIQCHNHSPYRRRPCHTLYKNHWTLLVILQLFTSLVSKLPCHAFVRPILTHSATLHFFPFRLRAEQNDVSQQAQHYIELGRQRLSQYFRFPLDDWQLHAGGAICDGCNVIVCASTGSGKTVVGEMSLYYANEQKLRGIYTTPLKALSNQKYADLIPMFGRAAVGLSTGDVSIYKREARMTVMTTEVYRNLAWRDSVELDDTAVCVLDEFHYMGYPGRGGVWEECVITSPPHIQ